MKICIVDTLGLSYDGDTLNRRGLGGSESAVILMSKELVKLGFYVRVYNDCTSGDSFYGEYDGVDYVPLQDIENVDIDFDVMISMRSVAPFAEPGMFNFKCSTGNLPNFSEIYKRSSHKVLWMHDTFCDGDQLIEHYVDVKRIDEIFTLSDFHTSYVSNCDHGKRRMFEILKRHIFQTRNGAVKYPVMTLPKDPNLFVYNASVTKGMVPLVEDIWPKIKKQIPEAQLVVIGGYYRFESGPDEQEHRFNDLKRLASEGVTFTGIITQREIAEILNAASFMLYPTAFPETFGISTLEALLYNTPIITCNFGAMEETAFDDVSYKIPYPIEPNSLYPFIDKNWQVEAFVNKTIAAHRDTYLWQQKSNACNRVKDIAGWDTVALQWKQHFYSKLGCFLDVDEYRKVSKINHKVRKVFGRRFSNLEENRFPKGKEKQIVVITPVHNAKDYIENCILSVAQQDYENYKHIIIDDCSTDGTLQLIIRTINSLPVDIKRKFSYIANDCRTGSAVQNQYTTIRKHVSPDQDVIVMLLDGDDWLVNSPDIFDYYSDLYENGAEFTYGSCYSLADNINLVGQEYSEETKRTNSYKDRRFAWNMPYTHLRTFHRNLMNYVVENDLKENGEWLKAGGDAALFYALIENAIPDKIVAVPYTVVNYNDVNPLNDYKVNAAEQTANAERTLSK